MKRGRRSFVKAAGTLACGALLLGSDSEAEASAKRKGGEEPISHCVMTTCLGCNARCGARIAVGPDGAVRDISGNPYHPYCTAGRPLDPSTDPRRAFATPSPVCGKAHEACEYAFDPYRIRLPLKRVGKRGEGKFEPIPWSQLIREVSDGGKLFASQGDERHYPGFRELLSDDPIDPAAPELGSKRNGLVFIGGRDQAGYQHFSTRFVRDAMGSVNRISHTDICGLGFRMGNYALTQGKDVELKADPMSCEYMLIFGANVYEALQPGINYYGALLAERHAKKELHFTVVDPRATHAAAHADRWLPIVPGQDGALALAMIGLIIKNKWYNAPYLTAHCPSLAEKRGLLSCTNACHLVITEPNHPDFGKFLRRGQVENLPADSADANDCMVQGGDGKTVVPSKKGTEAALFARPRVALANGQSVQTETAFSLLAKEANAHTLDEYSALCGIDQGVIRDVTKEFCSHGTKAAVCQYHGCGNYVGGTQASYAVALLNVLIGSCNAMGGYLHAGGSAGPWNKGLYDLTNVQGKPRAGGVKISREGACYEKSSEYAEKKKTGSGYPAKRPWFSFTRGGLCVEAMNGIAQKYPYACRILCTFFFNPVYSIPGGTRYKEALMDQSTVPLHISIDICVNESNVYADYIVPDLTWLEGKYSFMGPHAPALRFSTVRIPAIEPLTGKTDDGRAFSMETFLIDVAEYLGLPGFGEKAIPDSKGNMHPLHRAEDFYMRALANLASQSKCPPASAQDCALVEKNEPFARYRNCLSSEEWQSVCTLALHGGVFNASYESLFSNGWHRYGIAQLAVYNEKMATSRNSITGERFIGVPRLTSQSCANGDPLSDEKDFPFQAVTYKMHVHSQSRSISHAMALELFPENSVHINSLDARSLSIGEGDMVRLTSRSCSEGVTVRAHVTDLVRKGCVALSFHYGHTQMGASPLTVKNGESVFLGGKTVCRGDSLMPDPARAAGASFNALGRLDESLGNTPLVDPLGGIPDFSSTRVALRKIDA